MNDEKQPNADTAKAPLRTPNREYQRMPRVIEGEALATSTEAAPPPPADDKPEISNASLARPEPAKPDVEAVPAASPEPLREGVTSIVDEPRAAAAIPSSEPMAPPAPPTPPRGYGLGAVAAASLGSAALAALAVFGLQTTSAPAGPSPALETRIAEIERQSAAAVKTPQASPASIAALEKRIASVETIATGAAEAARKAAEAAASRPALNQQNAQQAAQQGASVAPQALSALGDRIALLEKTISAAPNVDGRIAAIEKALAAPKTDEQATETRVEPTPPPDLDPLRKQTAALEARLQTLERQTAPLAEAARAEEARKRAEALALRSAGAAQIALAQSVSAAIIAGAPFAAQIEALARLGLPPEKLAPLRESAKTGVATNADLARTLATLEPKIVARAETPADASVIDRLTNSALGLVRIKPAGDTTGASPVDVYARIVRAVQTGDIALAINEWDKLPDTAKAASADWAKRAKERVAVEGTARALLAEQAQTLGRS